MNKLEKRKRLKYKKCDNYYSRRNYNKYKFGKELNKFELEWFAKYSEYPECINKDVVKPAEKLIEKWKIGL